MPHQASYRGASTTPTLASDSRSLRTRVEGHTATSLIPRPKEQARGVFARASGGQSLQSQMHLPLDAMKQLTCKLRLYIQKYLNKKRPWAKQDKKALEEYMKDCHKIAKLQNYVGCWPAESYCRLYLTLSAARAPNHQQPTARTRRAREDTPRTVTMRSASPPNREKDPGVVEVKTEVLDVGDDLVELPISGSSNESARLNEPPGESHLDLPRTDPSCSLVGEETPQLTISEFVATIEPPQPGLDTILLHAGLQRWQDLQRLGRDLPLQDRLLDMLVREDKITRFQSVLLGDALKKLFVPK